MKYIMLCLLNVALLACGQLLFRHATHNREVVSLAGALRLFASPYAVLAVGLYAGATILWMYILTKMPLSHAYPIQALAFPLVVVLSFFFFQEAVPLNRWIGLGIIVIGVFIASK